MKLIEMDSQERRIISLFSEYPPRDELWNQEKAFYDIDRIEKWKLGIDWALYIDDIFINVIGPIPKNVWEKKYKIGQLESRIHPCKKWFRQEQGLILVCLRGLNNGKRPALYYLSYTPVDLVREKRMAQKRFNTQRDNLIEYKLLSFGIVQASPAKTLQQKESIRELKEFQKLAIPKRFETKE